MLGNLTGWHLIIILAVVLLLFGATRLPSLAKGIGQSARILKDEIRTIDEPSVDTGERAVPAPPDGANAATPGA